MSFAFLHTADWQIGKPFGTVPGDAGAELRAQRFGTVSTIAALAQARGVDAVLVAGDVFDRNEVDDRTINRLLQALRGFDGDWVFLPGNHDAALPHSVWTRLRQMQPGANVVVADTPQPIDRWGGRAVVLPAPLRRRREGEDQTVWFDGAETPPGAIRVGLAHGSVPTRLPGTAEAANPIPETRVQTARLDYLALGDWHGLFEVSPRAFYSGTPETDRHRANSSGQVLAVEIAGPGAMPRVEPIRVGRYGWRQMAVELLDGTAEALLAALAELEHEPGQAVVSLTIAGSISLAERHRLAQALEGWRARLHHLDVDDGGLLEDPTPDDLDALDSAGFVRQALDALKAKAADPADPEAAAARVALRMAYLDHMRSVAS